MTDASSRSRLVRYLLFGELPLPFAASASTRRQAVASLCAALSVEDIEYVLSRGSAHPSCRGRCLELVAAIAVREPARALGWIDDGVRGIDDLRHVVGYLRDDASGRRSIPRAIRTRLLACLERCSDEALFEARTARSPSIADILRVLHPKPGGPSRRALFGYLRQRDYLESDLPPPVRAWQTFKARAKVGTTVGLDIPTVPPSWLRGLELPTSAWRTVAARTNFAETVRHLPDFLGHGVFDDPDAADAMERRLRDVPRPSAVHAMELLWMIRALGPKLPRAVRGALSFAFEHALSNTAPLEGSVCVLVDVGSGMHVPIVKSGPRRCHALRGLDIAAMVVTALRRSNLETLAFPVQLGLRGGKLPAPDRPSSRLAACLGAMTSHAWGGLTLAPALRDLNDRGIEADLVIYITANDSLAHAWHRDGRAPHVTHEWARFRERHPGARLVGIDVRPSPWLVPQPGELPMDVRALHGAPLDLLESLPIVACHGVDGQL